MFDFILAYFVFLPLYPVLIGTMFYDASFDIFLWIAIAIGIVYLLSKMKLYILRKFFIAIWIMPGTIVCGAGTIVPWPFTISYLYSNGGCVTLLSFTSTLGFNLIIVFGLAWVYSKWKIKRSINHKST